MAQCKKCGAELVWLQAPGRDKDHWTPFDAVGKKVQFRFGDNDPTWVTGVSLHRHYCPKPQDGQAPRQAPAQTLAAPPDRDATMPVEPARFSDYDDDMAF